jgi:hypothetical protein
MKIGWSEVWSAAGVIVGLQGATIAHRVHGRGESAGADEQTWLPPAELLSLLSMSVIIFGTFIVPVFLSASLRFARFAFGLGLLLFAGHVFALAGHYEMFNAATVRKGKRFPLQEQIIVGIVLGAALAYTILALSRSDI